MMATFMVTHYGGFFAEVPIRSKSRGPRRRSRTTDIFCRGVESCPYFHRDARDVKRTVGERAEDAARLVLGLVSPRAIPPATTPASLKPPRSTWLVSGLHACFLTTNMADA
jgi:hypothetical protein